MDGPESIGHRVELRDESTGLEWHSGGRWYYSYGLVVVLEIGIVAEYSNQEAFVHDRRD